MLGQRGTKMQAVVTDIRADDHDRWVELWTAYLTFYKTTLPQDIFDSTWQRLITQSGTLRGFGVRESEDGPLLGLTHYLLHETSWSAKPMCYLQDLFVDESLRGKGLARKLILKVAETAKELDCYKCYWSTQENNVQARLLYDKVAIYHGFIKYDFDYSKMK